MASLIYSKKVLIFGCGNVLFGDDAFGPKVVEHLNAHYPLPDEVLAVDAGTAVREFFFDLILLDTKPEQVLIIDALSVDGRSHGEVFEAGLSDIPENKQSDFSLHQSPSVNMLVQLKEQGVDVRLLGMQTPDIPNEINPGLSPAARKALPVACDWIIKTIRNR